MRRKLCKDYYFVKWLNVIGKSATHDWRKSWKENRYTRVYVCFVHTAVGS